MRMMDQTAAFPRKVNIDMYKPIIDAAAKAPLGDDKLPRVVVEDYPTDRLALRAANKIRQYAKDNNLGLRVSCPEKSKTIFVWKGAPHHRTRRKTEKNETTPASVPPAAPSDTEDDA